MASKSYAQYREIEEKNRDKFKKLNPNIPEMSGIYILYRKEDGIKYAYVGQAKHILTRLAQHLSGYQHIDVSLRKHGLYSEENPCGYNLYFERVPVDELDDAERRWIFTMADKGFQLRNKTIGGQDSGKKGMDNQKPRLNYHDGLVQGRKALAKELKRIIDMYLEVSVKKKGKRGETALEKFWKMLETEEL